MNTKAITKMFKKSDRLYIKPTKVGDQTLIGVTDGHRLLLTETKDLPNEYQTALLAFPAGAMRYLKDDAWKTADIDIERILPKADAKTVEFEVTINLRQLFGRKSDTMARILAATVDEKPVTIHVNETYMQAFLEVADSGTLSFAAEPGTDAEFKGAVLVYSDKQLIGLVMPLRK